MTDPGMRRGAIVPFGDSAQGHSASHNINPLQFRRVTGQQTMRLAAQYIPKQIRELVEWFSREPVHVNIDFRCQDRSK